MQVSESWMHSFVAPDLSASALAHRLTMAGLEVEEVRTVAPVLDGVVVAQVLTVTKHPSADRLKICTVDVGQDLPLQIVCGAANVNMGIKVPCARIGTVLPVSAVGEKPLEIKLGVLRGVESQGMLCSAKELQLPDDGQDGLLILDNSAVVGRSLTTELNLDEQIFTIKLTPNRADCLSVLGIAREVSALTGAPLNLPAITPVAVTLDEIRPVNILASDLCGRFSGRVLRDVNARAATPAWMVRRLQRAGQRSVSALVDISNYVMLEMGLPTHIFDLEKIQGDIDVRWAKAEEIVTLLNGQQIKLAPDVGVIASAQGVEGLAGMMGGEHTAVNLDTQHIYIEAAFWWPQAIRGKSRRFNFTTEAAHRFERGTDYAMTVAALERVSALVLEICGGRAGPVDDQIKQLPQRPSVTMRLSRAQKILGVILDVEQVRTIFTRLGLAHSYAQDIFTVTPPSFRFDLEIEEDLIEEVARIYGFENIPAHAPVSANALLVTNETQRSQHTIRRALAARAYQEVVNFSFVDPTWETQMLNNATPIKLLNPIASQLAVMRSSLLPGLVENIRYNLSHKASRVRVFEVGRVFHRDTAARDISGIAQPLMVAAAAYGLAMPEQWGSPARGVDYFDIKSDLEALLFPIESSRFIFFRTQHPLLHPGRSASLILDGVTIGHIGELHPQWQQQFSLPQSLVLFEATLDALRNIGFPCVQQVSKFPPVIRDLSLVVANTFSAQAILDNMHAAAKKLHGLVKDITLFDVFVPNADNFARANVGPQEKSLAFRVTLQDTQSTLQDDAVEAALQALVENVKAHCGARLRS